MAAGMIAGVAAAAPLCGVIALMLARSWAERGAIAAMLLLGLRLISHHVVDALLDAGAGPFTLSRLAEFRLLGLIALGARLCWGYPGRSPSHAEQGSP